MGPLLIALALAAAPPKPPALDCGPFTCRYFDSPRLAFAEVLQKKPLVVGIGEYHQLDDGSKVKSAIKRFTETMLPLLKGRASDLVAETWITNGHCGKVEKVATQQIEKQTERPATTEDEVVTMLKASSGLGLQPHILTVECDDYQDLLDKDGEVDDVKLLQLVTRLLREKAEALLEREPRSDKAIVIYGGALHNELSPSEDFAEFSFAPDLQKASKGRYLQLGLYVPEFVERDDDAKKAAWFPYLQKLASPTRTLLISLGPDACLIVFPRTALAARQPPAKR